MCVLHSGSSKSCGKSPVIHFCWNPLESIFKRILIVIFIGIMQLEALPYETLPTLLYCIYFHTSMIKGSKMLILGRAQKQNRLISLVRSFKQTLVWKWDLKQKLLIGLHISSIVPKTWEKWFSIVQESYEKIAHSKVKCFLHISQEAEIHTIPKTRNMGIKNLLSTGKLWKNTNIPKVWISYMFHAPLFRLK